MDKAEAIERLEYLKARAQIALEQEVPEWIAEDLLGTIEAYDMAIEALRTEPKRGEWKNHKDEHYCTNCGEVVIGDWYDEDDWYTYCPNCGADMRKESE